MGLDEYTMEIMDLPKGLIKFRGYSIEDILEALGNNVSGLHCHPRNNIGFHNVFRGHILTVTNDHLSYDKLMDLLKEGGAPMVKMENGVNYLAGLYRMEAEFDKETLPRYVMTHKGLIVELIIIWF